MKSLAPYQKNGLRYATIDGQRVCIGANMGRCDVIPDEVNQAKKLKLHLRRIELVDGGYDAGGAYWGIGNPLFCAWDDQVELYLRETNREEAKKSVLEDFPNAKFYR